MKLLQITVAIMLLMGINYSSKAQNSTQLVDIQTNAVCNMCKQTIETALYNLQGVKLATLNMETKVVTVKYKTAKVSAEAIKQAIVNLGYNADDLLANPESRKKLPYCCTTDNH